MARLEGWKPAFGSTLLLRAAGVPDAAVASDPGVGGDAEWGDWLARRARHRIGWGLWEQNIYARIRWLSEAIKDRYDLYDGVRSIYSPGHRIAEFFAERTYPGTVDMKAGDGTQVASGCPIVEASDPLRQAIATIWRDSVIGDCLESWVRFGAICGDAPLAVVDDPVRRKVYFRPIFPGTLREYDADPVGNCRGYVIEEMRPDPEHHDPTRPAPLVRYTEVCWRSGESVVYHTYRDGDDYDWRDYDDPKAGDRIGWEWSEPYGFVPMVMVRHRNIGFTWGAGEYYFSSGKLMEIDGLASRICDQLHKIAGAPFYFEGGKVENIRLAPDLDQVPERDRYPMLGGEGRPHPMVVPMSIGDALSLMKELREGLERSDHPELIVDQVGANASGESRREARTRAEGQVVRRRQNYDAALVRAHQMAISIAAQNGYEPYAPGFSSDSYAKGDLNHAIGERPVFMVDSTQRLEDERRRGWALRALTGGGLPLAIAMRRVGFSDQDVQDTIEAQRREQDEALERARAFGHSEPKVEVDVDVDADADLELNREGDLA